MKDPFLSTDSACTLREAIDNLNDGGDSNTDCSASGTYGSDDTIEFESSISTICLVEDLSIEAAMTIQGSSSQTVTLDGGNDTSDTTCLTASEERIFDISSGLTGVTLNYLTIKGGSNDKGGGHFYEFSSYAYSQYCH